MGLFDELDVASAADDPFGVPEGMYECTVKSAEVKKSEDKFYREGVNKVGLMLTYTVTQDGEFNGEEITEYKAIPIPEDKENLTVDERRALSFLKQRMLSLGIPEARINSVDPTDLEGIDCYVTVKKNKGYSNITEVKLMNDVTF